MTILSDVSQTVKNIQIDAFPPGGEDKALLESNLSAPSGPSGASAPVLLVDPPDGLKAINSPANDVSLPKPASNNTLSDFSDPDPASVGLSKEYANCHTPEIIEFVTAFREYCRGLENSPCAFLHLKHKTDGSTVLFRVNGSNASRYFQQGRTRMIKDLRQRLDGEHRRGVFFHLTVDVKRCNLLDAWASMWKEFNRFKKSLNVYRKRHMNARHGILYLAVLEPHKSDYPHLHVYCPGLDWLIKKPDLSKMDHWWKIGSVTTEKELRRDSARSYITKYISKLDGWSEVSLAMLWHFEIRIYNMSHQYRTGDKLESEWELQERYTDVKSLAKGLGMGRHEAEALLEAFADMDGDLIYLTIPEEYADSAERGPDS